jgi:hypothetical protein
MVEQAHQPRLGGRRCKFMAILSALWMNASTLVQLADTLDGLLARLPLVHHRDNLIDLILLSEDIIASRVRRRAQAYSPEGLPSLSTTTRCVLAVRHPRASRLTFARKILPDWREERLAATTYARCLADDLANSNQSALTLDVAAQIRELYAAGVPASEFFRFGRHVKRDYLSRPVADRLLATPWHFPMSLLVLAQGLVDSQRSDPITVADRAGSEAWFCAT